ncbi:PREDICTED: cuticle collagen 2C-like [Capra hircus]|uniref:cuticle collagen 2C-like n=1 Tax=Capra hircus TaxID=9925 RepID=UPI0008467FAE|nr:PREDICTED: cuticle collagen 2C-like [Capra hircus]
MTHGGWQGSGEAGPGPRSSPQQMPARPSLPSPAKPARSPGAAGAPSASAGPERPGLGPHLPPGPHHPRLARPPLPPPPPAPRRLCGPGRAHSGKLLGPRRREGRKGGERRRRGPGGQQPGPPGSQATWYEGITLFKRSIQQQRPSQGIQQA